MTLESLIESLSSVPYDSDLTPETLELASGKAGNTMPGSLYFKSGRIRLDHKNGPKISKHERIRRYSLSERGVRNLKRYKRLKWNAIQIEEVLKKHRNLHDIAPLRLPVHLSVDNGERLIEFFKDKHGKTRRYHLSRGGPIKKPDLNQVQINLIARAADLRSNTELQNMVMKAIYPYALSHIKLFTESELL